MRGPGGRDSAEETSACDGRCDESGRGTTRRSRSAYEEDLRCIPISTVRHMPRRNRSVGAGARRTLARVMLLWSRMKAITNIASILLLVGSLAACKSQEEKNQ